MSDYQKICDAFAFDIIASKMRIRDLKAEYYAICDEIEVYIEPYAKPADMKLAREHKRYEFHIEFPKGQKAKMKDRVREKVYRLNVVWNLIVTVNPQIFYPEDLKDFEVLTFVRLI